MEIVSEPDLRSPEEAGAYLRKLRTILRYLGTCDGNMEEGSMRADVNVSVRKHGEPFRTRCEVKNVNSVRFVMQAIEAEAKRQIEVWEVRRHGRAGDPAVRRGARRDAHRCARKEDAHDYRYFPDPDLLPLVLDEDWIAELKARAAGAAGRQEARASCATTACRPTTPACWWPSRRRRISTRRWRRAATPSSPPTG